MIVYADQCIDGVCLCLWIYRWLWKACWSRISSNNPSRQLQTSRVCRTNFSWRRKWYACGSVIGDRKRKEWLQSWMARRCRYTALVLPLTLTMTTPRPTEVRPSTPPTVLLPSDYRRPVHHWSELHRPHLGQRTQQVLQTVAPTCLHQTAHRTWPHLHSSSSSSITVLASYIRHYISNITRVASFSRQPESISQSAPAQTSRARCNMAAVTWAHINSWYNMSERLCRQLVLGNNRYITSNYNCFNNSNNNNNNNILTERRRQWLVSYCVWVNRRGLGGTKAIYLSERSNYYLNWEIRGNWMLFLA